MSDTSSAAPDESVFSVASMLKYMGSDAKALTVVVKIVTDAIAPGLAPLEQATTAIHEGRLDDACRIFHVMRGTVGSLGTKRFVQAALDLELALRDGHGDFDANLAAVGREYRLALDQAAAWLAAHGAGGRTLA
ncbi:Hpt domain-containing protein [Rugamonas sp.]|uniref:Hpt domain-containing protein n=1 Tax=Rugamonas sp. TaxID=1926287 RepID=UPI0025D0E3B4|nr:Hpt domain-containing protein [Rugamonas sp.]